MTGIFFYSILIFILLSVFVPSIYKYAYSCFIGRIVLVLLIIYFSKHNIILGLIFVTIIIIASMPLYEGFSPQDTHTLAKNMLVTSNTSIKDKTNHQQVFDYFTKYYCAKDSTSPNTGKLQRWNDILKSGDSDSDSKDIALANTMLQAEVCSARHTPIVESIPELASYDCTKCQNDMFACKNLPQSNPLKNGRTIPANTRSLISTDRYDLYDAVNPSYTLDGKNYWWRQEGGCPGGAKNRAPPPAPDNSQYYKNYNDNWYAAYANSNASGGGFVNVDPRSISGCSYKGTNHVLNTPGCLSENMKSRVCNDESIRSIISTAQNVSNNHKLDPYLQQDGQWMLNMYSQLCETSPVI